MSGLGLEPAAQAIRDYGKTTGGVNGASTNARVPATPAVATPTTNFITTIKPRTTGQATTGQTAQTTKINATQPQNVNPRQVPNWANPQSQEYVGRREASRRMSAAQQTTLSTTPNFGGQQQAVAPSSVNYKLPSTPTTTGQATNPRTTGQATTTANAPSAFGDMAAQLAARPTTSSTGGTTKGVAGVGNGIVSHTANTNNPNLQPTTALATPTTAPTPAARDAITKANQPNQQTKQWKGPEVPAKKVVDKESVESVGESRVDFGAMLFNRMKSEQ